MCIPTDTEQLRKVLAENDYIDHVIESLGSHMVTKEISTDESVENDHFERDSQSSGV